MRFLAPGGNPLYNEKRSHEAGEAMKRKGIKQNKKCQ
jgi:hypothetical protein